ncbi:hypothetical protein CJ030_MR1G029319 [Morella rubra]|uniref:Uncharacterized protein n=1 Tax=Morella rubra TaxID=262757 RepID=A0A6A1WQK9_9ROSI|nr:hypothetical protein CJ030_MR1G029319 [Morella rubra]
MARGKRARHSLADADQPVTVEERRQLILGRSVQMEREARPLELQGLNFEGRTIHDVIHSRGWDPITVQSGTISLPVVRAFYVGLMEQLTHCVEHDMDVPELVQPPLPLPPLPLDTGCGEGFGRRIGEMGRVKDRYWEMGKVKDWYWEIGWVRAWEISNVKGLGEGFGAEQGEGLRDDWVRTWEGMTVL